MYTFIITVATSIVLGLNSEVDDNKSRVKFGEFTDSRDNHVYKTVKIGSQEWMAENFAYLPYICTSDSVNCGIWVYNYNGINTAEAKKTLEYNNFGGLYSWELAIQLAPEGWHLPSDDEWAKLEKQLGIENFDILNKTWRGANNEANRLKKKGDIGLDVIFGGWMTDYGKFNFIGEHANFWCSTEVDNERGCERLIGVNNGKIGRDAGNKGCGFSVRYIKD